MNKEEITFDEDLLEKYKVENEKLSLLCKKMDNDKFFQKRYRKYLKNKEQLKITYNKGYQCNK